MKTRNFDIRSLNKPCKKQEYDLSIYLQQDADVLDSKLSNHIRRYRRSDSVSVVIRSDLTNPEQRILDGRTTLGRSLRATSSPLQEPVEPYKLRAQRLRCDVQGKIVHDEELMVERSRPCNGEVNSVGEVGCTDEVRGKEREGEFGCKEVDNKAAVRVPVGGVVEEGGAVGEPGHGSEGARTGGRAGVTGIGVRVSKGIDFGEMVCSRCGERSWE